MQGLSHFWAAGDGVGRAVALLLLAMSVITWYLIASKSIVNWRMKKHAQAFLAHFWDAPGLPARLRAARERAGLTQEGLAEAAGVSTGLIGQLESAATLPSLPTIERLARALGVSPCHLLVDDPDLQRVTESLSFTPADFLACDGRFAEQFAPVGRAEWTDVMRAKLGLDGADPGDRDLALAHLAVEHFHLAPCSPRRHGLMDALAR